MDHWFYRFFAPVCLSLHLDAEIDVADVPPFVAKSLSCLYENNGALPYAARSPVVPKCQSAAMKNRTVVTAEIRQ